MSIDAHRERCEWCDDPVRGFAEWQGDGMAHPSCGKHGHGFEPTRPEPPTEVTREALARAIAVAAVGDAAYVSVSNYMADALVLADKLLAAFHVTPRGGAA